MRITIGGASRILGLLGSFVRSAHRGVSNGVNAIVQALAKQLDLGNTVQIAAGQQTTQVTNQLFEFTLGSRDGFGNGGHKQAFHSRKQR